MPISMSKILDVFIFFPFEMCYNKVSNSMIVHRSITYCVKEMSKSIPEAVIFYTVKLYALYV